METAPLNVTPQGSPRSRVDSSLSTDSFRFEDHSQALGAKIWSVTFDLPGEKVNKLGEQALSEFESLLPALKKKAATGEIEALVFLSGKKGNFIAGADIKLFETIKTADDGKALAGKGHVLYNQWEDLSFPKIMAIDGTCLGGGLELSLASDAMVVSKSDKTKLGFPEVMLGIIPGLGGCVRCPQKIGIAQSLDLILTGRQVRGASAFRMGLADAILPQENFRQNVLNWTAKNLKKLKSHQPMGRKPKLGGMGGAVGSLLEGNPLGRSVIFSKAKEGVMKKSRGHYPAPLEALQVVKEAGTTYGTRVRGRKRDRALEREARGFGKCSATDISRYLIGIFFMTEAVKRSNGLPEGTTVPEFPVQFAGVLGAGTMGGGIAQLFAAKNIQTRMKDITTEALAIGIKAASGLFKKQVKRRRLTKRQMIQKLNHIAPVLTWDGFGSSDMVVEAIIEKMDIKKSVLAELETHVPDECVIATNTSSLSVSEMQTALKRPENFVGMHFFNPVHRMPLIEVIRGDKSSDKAVAAVYEFSKKIGKTPVVVKDGAGFLVNRLLVPYLNEAIYLVLAGAPVEDLDEALLDFGMPMGPMELIDEVGVDVGDKVLKILFDAFGPRMTPAPATSGIVEAGRLGKKTNKGIYQYEGKGSYKKKTLDPEIYKLLGVQPKKGKFKPEEMVERCVLPMINEASRCLQDQIVSTPEDVDLGMIMGTGFPPFRGGLLRYADSLGAAHIVERLKHYAGTVQDGSADQRYNPAEPLLQKAQSGESFYRKG